MPNSTFSISPVESKLNSAENSENNTHDKNSIFSDMSRLHGDSLAVDLKQLNIVVNNGTLKMSSNNPVKYIKNNYELIFDIFENQNSSISNKNDLKYNQIDVIDRSIITITHISKSGKKKECDNENLNDTNNYFNNHSIKSHTNK